MKLNWFLLKSIIIGAVAGLLLGFDTAVIAGTTHLLTSTFALSPARLGFTVSSALWGTVIGAMFSGIPGQRIGGRETLRITALLYLVSALGCALAWNWPSLVFFRFIGGLAIGASSVISPVYIAELAPAKWRGRLVGSFQINIVVGVLIAYFSNYMINRLASGTNEWRWDLGVAAIPAILFFVMLFGIPRSPRWLAMQDRRDEAGQVLRMLGSPNAKAELNEILSSLHVETKLRSAPLFERRLRLPILLAMTIAVFNQLTGINAILYYLNDIFSGAGFSQVSANLQAVAVGAMLLVATSLAMAVIDYLGRKTLLLIGAAGMSLCLSGVAGIFFSGSHQNRLLWLLVAYIFFFAVSQGSVIWVYISEIFPTTVRAKGQSLGCSTHWIMNGFVSGLFPVIASHSKASPFAFFAAMMVVQFLVVLVSFPETKGITLEQMQYKLGIDRRAAEIPQLEADQFPL